MLRSLVLVGALGAVAGAHPPPPEGLARCWRMGPETYPVRDAHDVARNTKAWVLRDFTFGTFYLVRGTKRVAVAVKATTPIVELDLPPLAANTTYSIELEDQELTTFKTGAGFDRVAPEPPALPGIGIRAGTGGSLVMLNASLHPGEVALEVEFRHQPGHEAAPFATVTTPTEWLPEMPGDCLGQVFTPGEPVCAEVRALDGAGNRSAPTAACTTVDASGPKADADEGRHDDEAMSYSDPIARWQEPPREPRASVIVGALAGGLAAGFLALVVMGGRARRRFANTTTVPVHAETVKRAARITQRRASILAVIGLGIAASPLFVDALRGETAALVASPGLALAVIAFASLSRSYWARDRLADPLAIATSDGQRYVFVIRADMLRSWLHASPRALREALGTQVPKATARPR